jgi:hypothetical protein
MAAGLAAASLAAPARAGDDCLLQPEVYHYLARVQDDVLERWELPPDVLANREVVVRLRFEADGSLREMRIESASDNRLKYSVAAAILGATPFPAIPPEAGCLVGLPIRTTFRNPAD